MIFLNDLPARCLRTDLYPDLVRRVTFMAHHVAPDTDIEQAVIRIFLNQTPRRNVRAGVFLQVPDYGQQTQDIDILL